MNSGRPAGPTSALTRQRGVTTVLLVTLLPAVLLIIGLAIDSAILLLQRRALQSRADTAAFSAAHQFHRGHAETAVRAALSDAAGQGLDPDSGASIEVFTPPASGTHAGRIRYVQVRIRKTVPLLFMPWLGIADPTLEASATAGLVFGNLFGHPSCLFALAEQTKEAVVIEHNGDLFANGCGLQVNSNASDALVLKSSASVSASDTRVVGGVVLGNGAVITPAPITAQPFIEDPLRDLAEPAAGACLSIGLRIDDTRTLQPGTYCDGIEIKKNANVTLLPGLYILLGGGLTVRSGATLSGTGVIFFNTYAETPKYKFGEFNVDSSAFVQLSAPTEGPWHGLLIFDTRSVAALEYTHDIGISADSRWSGLLYAPQSAIALKGSDTDFSNQSSDYLGVLAQKLTVTGRVQMNMAVDRVPVGDWHDVRWVE